MSDDLFPGMVIHVEGKGRAVVTDQECPSECGLMIMFEDGHTPQCSDSTASFRIVVTTNI